MTALPLLAGAAFGLSVVMPFGPVSLVCIERSLARSWRHGAMAGLGAASVHGSFGTAASLGAGLAADILAGWGPWLRLGSAAILVALGLRTLLRRRDIAARPVAGGTRAAYFSTLLLAVSNPMTILPYLALATAGPGTDGHHASPWTILGILLGTALWYAVLSTAAAALRGRLARLVPHLNLASGIALIAFGLRLGAAASV